MKKAVLEWAVPGSAGSGLIWPARAPLERLATTSRVGSKAFFDPRMVSSWLDSWMRLWASSGREEMARAVMSWMGVTGSTAGIWMRSVVMIWAAAMAGLETPVRLVSLPFAFPFFAATYNQ